MLLTLPCWSGWWSVRQSVRNNNIIEFGITISNPGICQEDSFSNLYKLTKIDNTFSNYAIQVSLRHTNYFSPMKSLFTIDHPPTLNLLPIPPTPNPMSRQFAHVVLLALFLSIIYKLTSAARHHHHRQYCSMSPPTQHIHKVDLCSVIQMDSHRSPISLIELRLWTNWIPTIIDHPLAFPAVVHYFGWCGGR